MSREQVHQTIYIGMLLAALPGLAGAALPESTVSDGPVTVAVRVDHDSAQVAEPVQLTLVVSAPKGTRVKLPQLTERLGEFDVRGTEQTNDIPAADGNLRRWSIATTLETIKTGTVEVPALDVHFATAANPSSFRTLTTKPLTVEIKSVLEDRPDPTKFRDIKETVDVAVPETHSYAWVGGTAAGVGAAVAVALATLVIVKHRRGPSPAQWALAAIADLRGLPIANSEDAEATYNEVVDVLREYFELEFNVPTLAKTTREFLTETTKYVKLDQTSRDRLASLASIADEIKFARLDVGEAQVGQALDQAEAFVHECEAYNRTAQKEAA
jgi:hypothetical protein